MNEQANQDAVTPAQGNGDQGAPAAQPGENKFMKSMDALKQGMEEKQPSEDQKLPAKPGDTSTVDWEKRYKDLQAQKDQEVEKTSKQLETLARAQLGKDPNYIHEIAQHDKALADRIIKSELEKSHGITSYDQLIAVIERNQMPEEQRRVLEKVESLEKKVEAAESKFTEQEQKEAELFLAGFKEQHPDYQGDVEKETLRLFKASPELTFEDAYNFTKWKMGIKEDENVREERIVRNLKSKDIAGALNDSSTKAGNRGKTKQYSAQEIEFLEGVGAKKTLKKAGY